MINGGKSRLRRSSLSVALDILSGVWQLRSVLPFNVDKASDVAGHGRGRSRSALGDALRVVVLCALLIAPARAAEGDSVGVGEPVIPPGQEALLLAMLGRGALLPGGCRLAAGGVDHSVVDASYSCPWGEVVFELSYPDGSAPAVTQTQSFAISLRSGSSPPALVDALAAFVRSRESQFVWAWGADDEAGGREDEGGSPPGDPQW